MEKKTNSGMTRTEAALVQFVVEHTDLWRDHRDTNYLRTWEEYERLWQGVFSEEDKTRQSERSRIVTPAIRQAVDSRQAEFEEAVFGRKEWFDIEDNFEDKDKDDVALLRKKLQEDFKKNKIKKATSQVIQLGEVFGTGIGELLIGKTTERKPAKRKLDGLGIAEVGASEKERFTVKLKPVHPKNFLIDPNALDIDDAMGVAVEEFISIHTIIAGIKDGTYRDVNLGEDSLDQDKEPTQQKHYYDKLKVKVLKYYGLVPKELLNGEEDDDELTKDPDEDETDELSDYYEDNYGEMVEAIVVLANDGKLLKAVANPYMMQDRPIVVYRPEVIAGRFWGCGTVEKGYSMQKALDGQIRMHFDAAGLATAPMMGLDATRMPRGFKFEIRPGKSVLTNGDPREVLFPFNFGQVNPVNVQTAELLERYLQQATGTLDSAGLPQQIGNQTDSGALAIAISGIVKKHKRALINFQEDFLIPFICKAAYRYMQFDPDNYPVKDYNFVPSSTLGIMAREYEQQQFIGLLQTLGPQSKVVPLLLSGIVENSSLSNRDVLLKALTEMSQPNPQEQAMSQLAAQEQQAKVRKTMAEAQKAEAEAQATPLIAKAKVTAALSNNLSEDNEMGDFSARAKMMELNLKKLDIDVKERDSVRNLEIAKLQQESKRESDLSKERTARLKIERDANGKISKLEKE